MNHSFKLSQLNDKLCSICEREFIMHTTNATCEACDRERCSVELSSENIAMCHSCITAHSSVIKDIIEESRAIDRSLTYNGDFFNAQTVAIVELKKAIDSDDSLSADEKQWRFQGLLAERYEHFKDRVFVIENVELKEAKVALLVVEKTIREFGDNVRKEIREKIRRADEKYQPILPKGISKVKIAKVKKSPIDNLIETIMTSNPKMTREMAIELITKGK